jgi:SAM-dependent methyltransferase
LQTLIEGAAGKTILDLGAAEGLISLKFIEAGAGWVDGVEFDASRVVQAAKLCSGHPGKAHFQVADLNLEPGIFEQDRLAMEYDYVLYLGVHHHLSQYGRTVIPKKIASRCREKLAIRTSHELFVDDAIGECVSAAGFILESHNAGDSDQQLGPLWVFRRVHSHDSAQISSERNGHSPLTSNARK